MPSTEIPRSRWRDFFESFSRQHAGWLGTLEIVGRDAAPAVKETPLRLVSVVEEAEQDAVTVTLGDASNQVEQTVYDVARVLLDEDFDGRHRGLDIESADGERTILRFRSAMKPEMLDGVLDEKG